MEQSLKTSLLYQLAAKDLRPALEELLAFLPDQHPATGRVKQLDKRLRELKGRMAMGTLSPQDIERTQARIAGGLREIVLDYNPPTAPAPQATIAPATAPENDVTQKDFRLPSDPAPEITPDAPPTDIGFHGTVDYVGSPSQKEATIDLPKSYGAAYHAAVQAVRHCGMDMEKGDRPGGTIHATSTGNTMARFGEVIRIWVTPLKRASTRIHLIVDSANPDTVFDLGRHQQKLDALLHRLRNS